jgi:nucleoside transporter
MSYCTEFNIFLIFVLIYMLVFLPAFSLANSLCFHHITDAKSEFPKIRVWGTIAWIIAGLLVGILDLEDQPVTMRIAGSISLLLSLYCFTLPATPPQQNSQSIFDFFKGEEIIALFRDKSFVVLISCIAVICIPTSYYYSFVNPFLNEMGVENAAGKMSIGQITEIVLMLFLPLIFSIFRLKTIIFWGLFLWGFRYLIFIIGIETENEIWYIIGLLVHGAAYIFATLTSQIYLDSKVPNHLRSTAQGFYSLLTFGIGAFIGSIIAGTSVSLFQTGRETHNWQMIWLIPSIIGILTAFVFLYLFNNKSKT